MKQKKNTFQRITITTLIAALCLLTGCTEENALFTDEANGTNNGQTEGVPLNFSVSIENDVQTRMPSEQTGVSGSVSIGISVYKKGTSTILNNYDNKKLNINRDGKQESTGPIIMEEVDIVAHLPYRSDKNYTDMPTSGDYILYKATGTASRTNPNVSLVFRPKAVKVEMTLLSNTDIRKDLNATILGEKVLSGEIVLKEGAYATYIVTKYISPKTSATNLYVYKSGDGTLSTGLCSQSKLEIGKKYKYRYDLNTKAKIKDGMTITEVYNTGTFNAMEGKSNTYFRVSKDFGGRVSGFKYFDFPAGCILEGGGFKISLDYKKDSDYEGYRYCCLLKNNNGRIQNLKGGYYIPNWREGKAIYYGLCGGTNFGEIDHCSWEWGNDGYGNIPAYFALCNQNGDKENKTAKIENCHITGDLSRPSHSEAIYLNGICNINYGIIAGCKNEAIFEDYKSKDWENAKYGWSNGICYSNYGEITACYNKGSLKNRGSAAGIAAFNEGKITGCYNIGEVSGSWSFFRPIGPSEQAQYELVGRNGYAAGPTITNCYHLGKKTVYSAISKGSVTNIHSFSDSWPTSGLDGWGIGNGTNGKYWKSLGSKPGTYPTLWWE